jgi:hypothetical protein
MVCISLRTRGAIWSRPRRAPSPSASCPDFAHGGLAACTTAFRRVLAPEQVGPRIAQPALHGELDFDDVLVFGEHRRIAQPSRLDHGVASDIHRTNLRDEDQFMALDRVRQAPVETRAHGGLVAAELRDDGLLAFLHDEEAGTQPDQDHDRCDEARADARAFHVGLEVAAASVEAAVVSAAAPSLAPEKATELAVEVAPELVKVRRTLVRSAAAVFRLLRIGPVVFGLLIVAARPSADRSG